MAQKKQLTKEGYKKLQDELDDLIHNAREEVKIQLAEARAQGDLSENADYDAARSRQGEIEDRIKEIEDILANCKIIEETTKNSNKIGLGSTVTVKYLESGIEYTYMIVGTVESDLFNNKISNESPLGEAVIGKSVGDIVDVKGKTTFKVQILKTEIK